MKTKIQVLIIFLLITSLPLPACEFTKPYTGAVAISDLHRDAHPVVPAADAQALLDGNNAFAFDIYGQVRGEGGNLIYSPYSISLAMAMVYAGARGETASQIASNLYFTLPPEQFYPAWNALALDLAQRPAQSKKIDRKNPMSLNIANAVWGQLDTPFEKSYLDLLAVNYGAGVRMVDFAVAPDPARQEINDWVDRETDGKIKEVIPTGLIDPTTRMVLANAIYFKAAWNEAFVKKLTRKAAFTLLDGTQIQVSTMQTDGGIPLRVCTGGGYQVVALPYKGELAEMVIILPDPGKFEAVESTLDADRFATILQELRPDELTLYMPKFEFTADLDLKMALSAMGMPLAFDRDKADFSNITKTERLYVQQALHKAYVLVDEEGTKAAAASIILMAPASALLNELHIDRPFIFIIRDAPTGTILFVGRVLNPLDR